MRVKTGTVRRKRHKKWIKLAKGYFGHKHISFKMAKQQVVKSWTYAFRDRKQVKRNYRALWIARINAALNDQNISYSKFINGLKKSKIVINRKMLSELAIHYPNVFTKIVASSASAL